MAAKRLTSSSVNWSALAERVPPNQKSSYINFKAKSDSYLRRVLANPAETPKIDWAFYKNKVAVPGMVDSFQKQYEALKIPYPADTQTAEVDAQAQQRKAEIAAFVVASNEKIAEAQSKLAEMAKLMPFEEMTMEDFKDQYPDIAWNEEKPTFYPHSPEFQEDDIYPPKESHH